MLGARLREAAGATRSRSCRWRSSGSSSSTRSSTRSTSASSTGGSSGRRRRRSGTYNYAKVLHDPVFHIALKNIAEYTAGGRAARDGARALARARRQPEDPRSQLLPRPRSTSRRSPRRSRSRRSSSTSSARTGCSTTSSASARTGSGTRAPSLWAIVGLNAWTTSGTVMLFYLAALQAIPDDVYEAAALDDTGAWRTFWKITFPLLRPAHFFCLVVFGIGALKLFDQAFIVSGGTGGPNYSTTTPILYIYHAGVRGLRLRRRRGGRRHLLRHHLRPHGRRSASRSAGRRPHDAADVGCERRAVHPAARPVGGRPQGPALRPLRSSSLRLLRAVHLDDLDVVQDDPGQRQRQRSSRTRGRPPRGARSGRDYDFPTYIKNSLFLACGHRDLQPLPLGARAATRSRDSGSPAASSCSCSCSGRSWCPTSCA